MANQKPVETPVKETVSGNIMQWKDVKRTLPGGKEIRFTIEMDFSGVSREDLLSASLHYLGEQWTHRNMSNNAFKNPIISMAAQDLAKQTNPVVRLLAQEELNRTRSANTPMTSALAFRKAKLVKDTDPIEYERLLRLGRDLYKAEQAEFSELLEDAK